MGYLRAICGGRGMGGESNKSVCVTNIVCSRGEGMDIMCSD